MNAILTISVGSNYNKMAKLTHPSIKAYADKIGAEFICIDESNCSTPHWEKFQIYNLLNKYKRIIYLDTDIIIRDDCPDLFDIVPEDKLGLFDEAPFTSGRGVHLLKTCEEYGISLRQWNGCYYNTGVIVVSQIHKYVFKKPEKEISNYYEQSYLNGIIAATETPVYNLQYRLNRMTCLDRVSGIDRHDSYIIHYAGYPNIDVVLNLIKNDLSIWDRDRGAYHYKYHLLIDVQGGLGDQICAEPAIRYLINNVYKDQDISVKTHFPRIFQHLPVPTVLHGDFKPAYDTPYYHGITLPGPETIQWKIVSNLLCHTVDYASMALLARTLPNIDKQIHLDIKGEDIEEVKEVIGDVDFSKLVLIHAGRHWESKPQPLYSKILTPAGWKAMGDIKLNDEVCTPDGSTAKVIEVNPRGINPVYKITFGDGRFTYCDKDHAWKVYHESWSRNKCPWKIVTLDYLINSTSKRPYYIPLTNPTYGYEKELPIDPYVLGCLLGNGCFSEQQSLQFSSSDVETINNIQERLIPPYKLHKYGLYGYTITDVYGNKDHVYKRLLKELELWGKGSNNKFVPDIYINSSVEQRLEIVRGLMDTDGYIGTSKNINYYTTSIMLAHDMQYLIRSLGGLCSITYKERETSLPNGNIQLSKLYTCNIRHDNPEIFFRLDRKKTRAVKVDKNIVRKCKIVNIEYVGMDETQCIKIDHQDHLYITDDFIVTHNTFPIEWWQEVVDGISRHRRVCLIGKEEQTRGTVSVDVGSDIIDSRNLFSLGGLFALISMSNTVLSNDSAPIHIAGAFDTNIVLIPTCKHPDHLLPWRHGSQEYKACSLYTRLVLDDCDSRPTTVHGSSAEFVNGNILDYLPKPHEVISKILDVSS